MAHVEIHANDQGGHTLIVDGIDLSKVVAANGCTIQPSANGFGFDVYLRVFATTLDTDLPDSIVFAANA